MLKKILFVAIAFTFIMSGCVSKIPLKVNNCDPETWVGGVKWLDNKTDYKDMPNLEIKGAGSINTEVESGEYAFTYIQPPTVILDENGERLRFRAVLLEFREVEIIDPTELYFGCED